MAAVVGAGARLAWEEGCPGRAAGPNRAPLYRTRPRAALCCDSVESIEASGSVRVSSARPEMSGGRPARAPRSPTAQRGTTGTTTSRAPAYCTGITY